MKFRSMLDFTGRRFRREQHSIESTSDARSRRALVVLAVQRWNWNWEDGGRTSHLRDLDHLDWLVACLTSDAGTNECSDLRCIAAELSAIISDRTSYFADGRMMTREAAARYSKLWEQLEKCRARLDC